MVGMYEMQKFMPKINCYHWLTYSMQFADITIQKFIQKN